MPVQADPWVPIRSFVEAINTTREEGIVAGATIVVDEAMSAWRGRSDKKYDPDCGLPHETDEPNKPVPVGLLVRVAADGETGILLHLELQESKEDMACKEYANEGGRETAVMRRLCRHYEGSGRLIVADSYYSSVDAAVSLYTNHFLYFSGIVKTASYYFPKDFLAAHVYAKPGDSATLITTRGGVSLVACGWKDSKLKMFISSYGITTPGSPIEKHYFARRLDTEGHNVHVNVQVPRPRLVQEFYDAFSKVDVHNHLRQAGLHLEETFKTKMWWMRSFMTFVGMIETDAFLAFKHFYCPLFHIEADHESFTRKLVHQLLEYARIVDTRPRAHHSSSVVQAVAESLPPCQHPPHVIRALRFLHQYVSSPHPQLRCITCGAHTAFYCQTCHQNAPGAPVHGLCSAESTTPECLASHCASFAPV